jgi:hypothetical protein
VTVTVSKADPSYTAPTGLTATEGDTLADVTLPANFTWNDPTTTPVGNVGAHSFNVTYTPTGTDANNYNTMTGISVTVTVSAKPYDPAQDDADISAAKDAVENATFGPVTQEKISSEAAALAYVQSVLASLDLNGVTATVVKHVYDAPVTGDETNPAGTDGSYSFEVELTKGGGTKQTTQILTLVIEATTYESPTGAPEITTTSLNDGVVGEEYSDKLDANGDTPISWSVTVSNLPAGLSLDPNTGEIHGVPATAGTFHFTVKATNGISPDATADLEIKISDAPIDEDNSATIGDGAPFNLTEDASGAGWTWTAETKTLTLTGGEVGTITIASESPITINITAPTTSEGITVTGSGEVTITGDDKNSLTVTSETGPAIYAEGKLSFDGGTVTANVTGTGETMPAIQADGGVEITGGIVTANNAGTGDGIFTWEDVTISGGEVHVTTTGDGYGINAGDGEGAITITGGGVVITSAEGKGTSCEPDCSGDTKVVVNGETIYNGGDGCATGAGMFGAILAAALAARKRRRNS